MANGDPRNSNRQTASQQTGQQTGQQTPSSSDDHNRRKEGFKSLFSDMTGSPEGRIALMQMGLGMLQPRAPGQSEVGNIAQRVGEGLSTLGAARVSGREAEAEASEQQLDRLETASQVNLDTARANYYNRGGAGGQQQDTDARRLAIDSAMEAEQKRVESSQLSENPEEFNYDRVVRVANAMMEGTGAEPISVEELEGQPSQGTQINPQDLKPLGNNIVEYQGQQFPVPEEKYREWFGDGS